MLGWRGASARVLFEHEGIEQRFNCLKLLPRLVDYVSRILDEGIGRELEGLGVKFRRLSLTSEA